MSMYIYIVYIDVYLIKGIIYKKSTFVSVFNILVMYFFVSKNICICIHTRILLLWDELKSPPHLTI